MSRHRADYQHYLASRTWARLRRSALRRARVRKRWGDQVQERRQILLDFLSASPGHTIRSLSSITGIPRSTVQDLLAMKAGKLLNTSRPPARSTINNPPPGCDFFPLPSLTSGKAGKLLNMVSGQDPLPEQLLPSVQPPLREAEAPEYGIGTPPLRRRLNESDSKPPTDADAVWWRSSGRRTSSGSWLAALTGLTRLFREKR